jgi:hypothetical protein
LLCSIRNVLGSNPDRRAIKTDGRRGFRRSLQKYAVTVPHIGHDHFTSD